MTRIFQNISVTWVLRKALVGTLFQSMSLGTSPSFHGGTCYVRGPQYLQVRKRSLAVISLPIPCQGIHFGAYRVHSTTLNVETMAGPIPYLGEFTVEFELDYRQHVNKHKITWSHSDRSPKC